MTTFDDALRKLTGSTDEKDRAGFILGATRKLAETTYRRYYERVLRLPAEPWGLLQVRAHPYHCAMAAFVEVVDVPRDKLEDTVNRLLTGTDETFRKAVGDMLGTAFEDLVGHRSPGTHEESVSCVTVTGSDIVRVDAFLWIHRFEHTDLTPGATNVLGYCAALSHVLPEETPLPLLNAMVNVMAARMKGIDDQERERRRLALREKMAALHRKGERSKAPIALEDVNRTVHAPFSVALDSSGRLYVLDIRTKTVWRKDSTGALDRVAGGGDSEEDGIVATDARLQSPKSLAVDGVGNLYIADGDARCVRRVKPNGIIDTIARSTGADTTRPYRLTVDVAGNVYVQARADTGTGVHHEVWRITPDGLVGKKSFPGVDLDHRPGLLADDAFAR